MPLVRNLKMYRQLINETQEDFANILGCSIGNYGMKESGKTTITLEEGKALADHISDRLGKKVTVDEIFFTSKITLEVS